MVHGTCCHCWPVAHVHLWCCTCLLMLNAGCWGGLIMNLTPLRQGQQNLLPLLTCCTCPLMFNQRKIDTPWTQRRRWKKHGSAVCTDDGCQSYDFPCWQPCPRRPRVSNSKVVPPMSPLPPCPHVPMSPHVPPCMSPCPHVPPVP